MLVIVNWNLRNKLRWNLNLNMKIFIQKMHLKMSSARWWPFCLSLDMLIMFNRGREFGNPLISLLTHWGRVMHICVIKQTIIGSDNGLAPGRRQPIIWTNAGISLIGPLGTNFSEIVIAILIFSFKKMCLKVSSAKWWPFCLGLNMLMVVWSFWVTTLYILP